MTIVRRILLLIASILLLIAGGEVINGLTLRQQRFEELRNDSVELATIAELDMSRILEGTRQVLATLAKLPADHGWDEHACSVLEATASSDFEYDHLVAVDRSGIILCSSSGTARVGTAMPDHDLIERIVATNRFALGVYGRGMVSSNEVIRVGYPVVDGDGAVTGAIYAGINVMWLNTAIDQWKLDNNATIDIADRNGTLIASYPDPRGVGQPIHSSLKSYLTEAGKGAAEVTGSDGIVRVYGYIPVSSAPSDGLAVFVGRKKRSIVAAVDQSIYRNLWFILVGFLFSNLVSALYVRRFLARPFQVLLTVAGRWRDGDWSARAGTTSGIPEFDRLALAFDDMAAAVSTTQEQISRMARHDPLTGLANRIVFVEALQNAIAQTRRGSGTFAVLYLDLDHFKDVNDTLGHSVGDLLLQSVAERLRASVRETDTVARFGGDEFAIIETNIREPEDAAFLASKLLRSISEPFTFLGNEIRLETSVGIAIYGAGSNDAESLISHADIALYRAKLGGRGTYRYFTDDMDTDVRTRVALVAELRAAIDSCQLFIVYQPQVDVDTNRIVGVEALVRWRHPTHGLMLPSQFIAVAEDSGLIVVLGRWVLREACRQMKEWLDQGIAPPLIAVNLSAVQFKAPRELQAEIDAILTEMGVPPERVELELTESVLMDASREHNDILVGLRKAGFRIAIDDFGTGYSCLDYLRRFPVDRIKIAQQFVVDSMEAPGGPQITKAAIALARGLALDVVVEGVETAQQLQLIRSWGAREVQGYYFSKPLQAEEIAAVLRKGTILPGCSAVTVETIREDPLGEERLSVSST